MVTMMMMMMMTIIAMLIDILSAEVLQNARTFANQNKYGSFAALERKFVLCQYLHSENAIFYTQKTCDFPIGRDKFTATRIESFGV